MKNLTNEDVALALGWHHEYWTNKNHKNWYTPKSTPDKWSCPGLPNWIGSLDVVTKTIEDMGLRYYVGPFGKKYRAQILDMNEHGIKSQLTREADSASMALCVVLVEWMEGIRKFNETVNGI